MDPNNEIVQHREEQAQESCMGSDDCTYSGGHPFGWVILAAVLVVLLFGGRTVRLVILGVLAIPLIGGGVVMGVPFLILYVFGDALTPNQRFFVSIGAIAGVIWLAFRWLDRCDRLDRRRGQGDKKPPN